MIARFGDRELGFRLQPDIPQAASALRSARHPLNDSYARFAAEAVTLRRAANSRCRSPCRHSPGAKGLNPGVCAAPPRGLRPQTHCGS